MQTIHLRKFGIVLVSRPAGLEAYNAIRPTLDVKTPVQIDFAGVLTVTPSWFDEFLTNLADNMNADVELLTTDNASVRVALPVLSADRNDKAGRSMKRAIEQMKEKRKN
ncbi:MAG: hypothetical protein HY340_01360 [Candidatus Kerfeldbacteria bacterium]|nr:hypothetical protein [Candidatus Kerfeldbacteria bacterium]